MYSIYDNLPSLDDILRAHEQGRVIISRADDYLVAKYSQKTVISGDWDDLTMSARGIIYDELTGEVVFLPFRKFFNHNENSLSSSSLPTTGIINAEILEKLDGCFHYDTPVMTPDGKWEKIGKIVKDKSITHVMGFDHSTGEVRPVKITDRFNNGKKDNWLIVRIKNAWNKKSGGGSSTILRVTSNHEFYTENGYVEIGSLKVGDLVKVKEPYEWKLVSAEIEEISAFNGHDSKLKNSQTAWDIETETHNFFAREVLVHNSMGAVWLDREGEVRVSTPGSLQSDQAIWATRWVRAQSSYSKVRKAYQSGRVRGAVSEILFPGSQVVVQYDYGQVQGIHLTAAQLTRDCGRIQYASHTELEELAGEFGFGHCDIYDFESFDSLRDHLREVDDFEGFVLHWPESGFRLKFKADEYIRLHRIISRIHPNRISEAIDSNEAQAAESFDDILLVVRDCIDAFPEEHRPPYDEAYEILAGELRVIESTIPPKVELISNSHSGLLGLAYRKMCAQDIREEIEPKFQAYAFALLAGKTPRLSKVAMRSWKRIRKEIDWQGGDVVEADE